MLHDHFHGNRAICKALLHIVATFCPAPQGMKCMLVRNLLNALKAQNKDHPRDLRIYKPFSASADTKAVEESSLLFS